MSLFHAGVAPALNTNAAPISGARWQFTLQGTTTPTAVYADDDLSTSLGSYVASDSAGRFVDIYLDDSVIYRARLWPDSTMAGTPIKDIDPVNGSGSGSGGGVTAESLGVSQYEEGTDQRFELQTAITAAEDAGQTLVLTQRFYEIWRDPTVLPDPAEYGGAPEEGEFLFVYKQSRIVSTHPMGSTIYFKGPNGGPLLTDYSVIDGTPYGDDKIHRGHGILLWGEASAFGAEPADEADLPALYLENITLTTGMVASLDPGYPAAVGDPNRWDLTNKCIASRGNYMNGKVELHNVTFDGFFGENTYLSGLSQGGLNTFSKLIARNWTVKNTNATFINVHGPTVLDIDGMYAYNCVAAWESWAGWVYGRIANCIWTNITGAGFHGGTYYNAPRRADNTQPLLVVDNVTIQGTPSAVAYPVCYVGSYVKATNLRLIDMSLNLVGLVASQIIKNTDIDCTIEVDKLSLDGAIHIAHPIGAAGCIENVQIRALLTRTEQARAGNFNMSGVKYQGGALATYGPNVTIRLRGDHSGYMNGSIAAEYGGNLFHANDIRPKIIDEGLHGTGNWALGGTTNSASAHDISASATPEAGLTWVRFTFGGAAVTAQYPANLTAVTKFNDGHEVTFEHSQADCPLATVLIDGRVVLGYGDSCTFRANRALARWDLVRGDNVMLGPLSVAGVIATGNAQATLLIPEAFTVRQVDGFLGTAQAASGGGGPLAFDVNEGGTTILSGDQTFDNTERTTRTAGTRRHVTDTALAAGAVVTLDVNVIGDGSGANLQVYLTGKWA